MTNPADQSSVVDFYRNKSIFITGASGFIGKVSYYSMSCYSLAFAGYTFELLRISIRETIA